LSRVAFGVFLRNHQAYPETRMSYAQNRLIHDADSHLMELADCLDPFLEKKYRADYDALPKLRAWPRDSAWVNDARAKQADNAFRAGAVENILLRRDYEALGAFKPEDRPWALDLLGFKSQVVFTTWCLGNFGLDDTNPDLAYATAEAHNRMMAAFCSVDRRFLPTAYIPLADFERAKATAKAALDGGAKALMVPSICPKGHSPSHVAFDPVWRMAEEAGLPIVFHVGGEAKLNPDYFDNGMPRVKDFHGGEENFTSVSYMMIPHSVMLTLAAMIFDGVLDRFPKLKVGVIELGASWVPSWMRFMDAGADAFRKGEERLKKLSLKPSEFVRRQVRVTPYPHEDTGWIIRNAGDKVCMFSSDFPHVEGGRNPLKRFDDSVTGLPAPAIERFYAGNFADLMGAGLAADLRGRTVAAAETS
jgi:predicted TIM-barrel fold metal-dependent hydrolase